ncbi:MAG: hypothetical protein EOP04_22240, partial [Proteobacteria bacterium]
MIMAAISSLMDGPELLKSMRSANFSRGESTMLSKMLASKSVIFGTFQIGSSELAIHSDFIQEVVDRPQKLDRFPLSPDFVVGLLNLRNRMIPILDLRVLLKLNSSTTADEKIVIVSHEGWHIGLCFDSTREIIRIGNDRVETFDYADSSSLLGISGVLRLEDSSRIVHVLDLKRLAELKGLLGGADALAGRETNAARINTRQKQGIAFLLGDMRLALDIKTVSEIVSIHAIESTPIQNDMCLGVISLRGNAVPLIDFSKLLGQKTPDHETIVSQKKALIVRLESESFALVIDRVDSIVSYGDDLTRLMSFNALQARLFKGCLPRSDGADILLLDGNGIAADKSVIEVMSSRRNLHKSAVEQVAQKASGGSRTTCITFHLLYQAALPMGDIQEIIPYSVGVTPSPGAKPFIHGMINLRGTMVTVIDLRVIYDLASRSEGFSDTRILIVRKG